MSSDRRRLAPRTSEDEALFIANKYAQNKLILEAKLANSLNGGRMVRQTMLDEVASELSAKFNVANRSRKYVEQKLRDMKKEARKFYYLQQNVKPMENSGTKSQASRTPPEPIRVMIEAMGDELKSGGSWEELDLYAKPMKLEKLDEPLDVERDLPSHQSASSSCESGVVGPLVSSYGGSNAPEKCTNAEDTSNHADSKREKHVRSTDADNICDTSGANWQAIYNQSLAALMNIDRDGGGSNYESAKYNHAKNEKVSHSNGNKKNNNNAGADFVLSLKNLMEDGCALSNSVANTAVGDPCVKRAASATAAGLNEEMFKTIAATSSLFFPANFYSAMFSMPPGMEGVMHGMMPTLPFLAPAMMGGINGGSELPSSANSDSNATRFNRHQPKEEIKNLSNPCSPFSASTSSVESLQDVLNGGETADETNNQTNRISVKNRTLYGAKAESVNNLNSVKQSFGNSRVKHSLMKRLTRDNGVVNHKVSDASNTLNSKMEKRGERPNEPLYSLNLLKRRLLLEEISGSRAFASLCTEVRKSVEQTAKSVINTHRLQSELIQAQLRLLPNTCADNIKDEPYNKRNTMTQTTMTNDVNSDGTGEDHNSEDNNVNYSADEMPKKKIRMS